MEADAESRAVKLFQSKRRIVIAAIAIILVLFLVRPGVSRLKERIANSISRAVARPVTIGSVHLRFLPSPGFDLENLVVEEDPAFGAEPMLRASEVMAVVRLTSLLRGRLEVSRLELSEPSLNLVRSAEGHWNLEALLERTAHTPLAPTAKSTSEARPGFPYIEASSGRINFKAGQEKKPYALLDADFALWQESENTWGVRLQASPLRTDMNLNDAGLLRMNGTWQRAESLRETPLQFSLEWSRAQLGQVTKLVSGNDKGWRGESRLDVSLKGIPAALQISADASVDDFHRYDISSAGGLRLRAHCDGQYSSVEHVAREIFCSAPVGNGMITLHGDAGMPGTHRVNLAMDLENVPMSATAQLALRAKKNLPADLVAMGNVQGDFVVREDGKSAQRAEFQGRGEITDFRVQSASNKLDLAPGSVPFVLNSDRQKQLSGKSRQRGEWVSGWDGLRLEYGSFPVALDRPAAAQVRGWVGRSGYSMSLNGDGEISHTLRAAILLGLPAMKSNVTGVAQMDLVVAGSWMNNASDGSSSFYSPQVTGKAELHEVRTTVRGTNGPIEIVSAELQLLPDGVRVDKLIARAGNARWKGSVQLPRNCGTPQACLVSFSLNADQVGLSGLLEWLRPPLSKRRWYQVLETESAPAPSFLQKLRAVGRVNAGRLLIRDVVANRVSASLDLDRGIVKISDLRADVLGGKHIGNWQIDFAAGAPAYMGSGTLTSISMAQAADAMHERWISGTGSATYQFKSAGADSSTFWQSADATLQFDLRDGVLPKVILSNSSVSSPALPSVASSSLASSDGASPESSSSDGASSDGSASSASSSGVSSSNADNSSGPLNRDDAPLRIGRWEGHAHLRAGKVEIDKGNLLSASGSYEISGTASLAQVLDFKLTRIGAPVGTPNGNATVYNITGTLAEPRVTVTPSPETQAQLKP